MKTNNPMLKSRAFAQARYSVSTEVMTVQGTINKTAILLLTVFIGAGLSFLSLYYGYIQLFLSLIGLGSIGGLMLAIVTSFKSHLAPKTAILYSLCQGLSVGGLSILLSIEQSGLVLAAFGLTVSILAAMMLGYRLNIIRPTERFKSAVIAAIMGVALTYLMSLMLSLTGLAIPFTRQANIAGIIFSVIVVVIASLNLVLDFAFVDEAIEEEMPKQMEWYAAFSLIVSIVWIYVEVLNLLSKISRRR